MATATVWRVNPAWLERKKQSLENTVKEYVRKSDGVLVQNPNYTELVEEIATAEAALDRWNAIKAFADEQGYKINRYPVKTESGNHEAGEVFYRKDDRSVVTVEEMAVRFDSAKQG